MKTEEGLADALHHYEKEMVHLLRESVMISSGTCHKAGVDAVAELVRSFIAPMDWTVDVVNQTDFGDVLVIRTKKDFQGKGILLVGHMDTVFPPDHPFTGFREDEDCIYGPGVLDMKGGIVIGLFALKALAEEGDLERIPITFILNSDEEVGSPVSCDLIVAEAKKNALAFVLECGGLKGQVVTGRKGRLGVTLEVRGQAGHAAFTRQGKASAILELAHKTIQLESLNGMQEGLTVNVGRISGGIGPNTVADQAVAQTDIRFCRQEDERAFMARLNEILSSSAVSGTRATVQVVSRRPPMTRSVGQEALYRLVEGVASRRGFAIGEEFRHGCSDANHIAAAGTPVLDGMGPIGDHDHSDREFIFRESLLKRSQLLALALREAWREYDGGRLFLKA